MKTIEEQALSLATDTDFIAKLEILSLYFDAVCGMFPEDYLEGYTILNFAKNPSSDPGENQSPSDMKEYSEKMKDIIKTSTVENKDGWFWCW